MGLDCAISGHLHRANLQTLRPREPPSHMHLGAPTVVSADRFLRELPQEGNPIAKELVSLPIGDAVERQSVLSRHPYLPFQD